MPDERRSFPTTDLPRRGILSPASTDNLERRSFPAPEFPEPELMDSEDAAMVQSKPAGDLAERRSFPALALPDREPRGGRRSFPAAELRSPRTYVVEAQNPLTNREAVAICIRRI
jgi:hypothetical protein